MRRSSSATICSSFSGAALDRKWTKYELGTLSPSTAVMSGLNLCDVAFEVRTNAASSSRSRVEILNI